MTGKTVLITGSSSGIGRETAFQFASRGWNIIITYRNGGKEALNAAKQCESLGASDVLVVCLDLTNNSSIKDAVRKAVAKFKDIDVLVNNAGVFQEDRVEDQAFEEIENQVRTNLEGLIKVTAECLPHVRSAIINVASVLGKNAEANVATYCATKFGVRGFTQALAMERPKLKIFSVNPGMTATRMSDFMGTPPGKVAEIIFNAAEGKYKVRPGGDVNVLEYL